MLTVLIIDEDVFSRNVFGRVLSNHGYQVIHADSKITAGAILSGSIDVDVIVVDSELDDNSGLEFVADLRAGGDRTPIVLFESMFSDQSVDLRQLQIRVALKKPISPTEFLSKIDELMGMGGGLDEATETEQRGEFAMRLEANLLHLEKNLRHSPDSDAGQMCLKDAKRLSNSCRDFGLSRVSQPLARVARALEHIQTRDGHYSRQLWAELNDSMDEAFVNARREVLELSRGAPARGSSTRQVAHVVLYDPANKFGTKVAEYGASHLIHVDLPKTMSDLGAALEKPGLDGIFVDLEHETTEDAVNLVRAKNTRFCITAIASAGTLQCRLRAAELGAIRFLERPVQGPEFADAVRFLTVQRNAVRSRVLVVHHDKQLRGQLATDLANQGLEPLAVSNPANILDELDALDPDALVLAGEFQNISSVALVRTLRSVPRWSNIPILCLNAVPDIGTDLILAGADDELPPERIAEVPQRVLARVRRARVLKERSDRDLLTGLLTRRSFLERVSSRLSEARRQERNISICMLDLDRFKRINDTYGHIVGDQVLIRLGRLLKERFRLEDLRCRWGGEEFAIALVNENTATAKTVLQRVLDEFSEIEFRSDQGELFNCTFSAGLAELPTDGDNFEDLLRVADERLFESKVAGRSRITQ